MREEKLPWGAGTGEHLGQDAWLPPGSEELGPPVHSTALPSPGLLSALPPQLLWFCKWHFIDLVKMAGGLEPSRSRECTNRRHQAAPTLMLALKGSASLGVLGGGVNIPEFPYLHPVTWGKVFFPVVTSYLVLQSHFLENKYTLRLYS